MVLLLTQSLESPSGSGRYYPLARQLVACGFSVTLIALHPDFASQNPKRFTVDGLDVRYVSQMHVRKSQTSKAYFGVTALLWITAVATLKIVWEALRTSFDVLIIAKPHPMNSLAGLFVATLRRRPIVLDCDDDEVSSNRYSGAWQRRIVGFFEQHVPVHARMITTNTLYTMNRLRAAGIPAARIVYLPNGVELARFAHLDPRAVELLRRKFALADRRVVAYIGSLSAVSHPLDLLLDAFALVRRRQPAACLLFVGGGEDYDALRLRAIAMGIADSVLFSGRVASADIPAHFGLAAVTVDPVNDDIAAQARSPLKLFESWAAGVPCVTGDVGDRRSLLGDPPAAQLVQPGSAEALAAGILLILSDPDFAEELSRRGLARSRAYQWNILAERLIAACDTAVKTGKR